jgi:AcrR family transcriptional regulator
MPEGARITTLPRRGDATRERLLDAAETLVADHGFSDPSHRALAGNAGVHVALVNYHFVSYELLFEEAVARRVARLSEEWLRSLARVRS